MLSRAPGGTPQRLQHADPQEAVGSPSPRSQASQQHTSLRLLEPRSTPRRRSRTRPANASTSWTGSPSPIVHGASYRSVDKSALFPPGATMSAGSPAGGRGDPAPVVMNGRTAYSRQVQQQLWHSHSQRAPLPNPAASLSPKKSGHPQLYDDVRLAETDHRLRRGESANARRDFDALNNFPGRTPPATRASAPLGEEGPSPLTLALRAQWALLRQQRGTSAALGPSHTLLAAAEKDLLRTLSALPRHDTSAVMREASELAPYLLAFAAAPVPTLRTQAVALAAFHGVLMGLPAAWGRPRAAALVRDLFTGENEALAAFDVALDRVLREKAADADDLAARRLSSVRRHNAPPASPAFSSSPSSAFPPKELRIAVMDSIFDILLDALLLCPAVASAALARGTLLRNLIDYLPEATATQAATVVSILQAILDAPDTSPSPLSRFDAVAREEHRRETVQRDRAVILASYNAHHVVLNSIRASVRATYQGRGDLAASATVTTLVLLIRVAVRLVAAPSAFDVAVKEDAFSVLVAQLLTLTWGEVVELTCLWVVELLSRYALSGGGPVLARNLLAKGEAVQVLTRLLGWRDRATFSYATSAALCWRWLFLSHGESGGSAAGAPAAEIAVAVKGIFLSFIHAILTNPMPGSRRAGEAKKTDGDADDDETDAAVREWRARCLFTCELVNAIATAVAAGTEYTRAAMRLVLLERLTPDIFETLRAHVHDTLSGMSDTYFSRFPTIVMEEGTELCDAVSAAVAAAQRPSGSRAGLGGGLIASQPTSRAGSSRERVGGPPAPSGRHEGSSRASSASAASTRSQTQRQYHSKYMSTTRYNSVPSRSRSRSASSSSSGTTSATAVAPEQERGRGGATEGHDPERDGARLIISTAKQWRILVQCSWDLLLAGEPQSAAGHSSRAGVALAVAPNAPSARKVPTLTRTLQGFSPTGPLHLHRMPTAAEGVSAAKTVSRSPAKHALHPPGQLSRSLTAASLRRQEKRQQQRLHGPVPAYQQCDVVERAMSLADSGSFYRETIQSVLRLSHQYAKAGVVGEAQLPLTASAIAEAELGGTRDCDPMKQFEASVFRLLVEERPECLALAEAAMSVAAERRQRRRSQERRLSLSQSSRASVSSRGPQRRATATHQAATGCGARAAPNPWAPPAKVRSTRRWQVKDLQRSDVLFFAISYEKLVPDLATAVAAVEAHVSYLREQLQTCPTREMTRRLVLTDLYMNVYPKLHLFLRYVQRQVARSRAVLQLLSETNGGGDVCIHSGNIVDVYDAVGHCVGNV